MAAYTQDGLKNGVNMNQFYGESTIDYQKRVGIYKEPAMATYRQNGTKNGFNMAPYVGGGYAELGAAAIADRDGVRARAEARQRDVTGGYDAQIARSRAAGEEGYARFSNDYKAITADAVAARERNMARVDQYGASMRDDLNRKNTQNLVTASQSAIQRGLGNTTIYDSLRRGANFDNTRQLMSLEDQLLQNRITTDSNLSKTYQDTLQSRAQGLASQWNQNMQNDNQLVGNKLGYIGSIQEPDNYRDVSNIYMQGLQEQNANQQAVYDREMQKMNIPAKYRLKNGKVEKSDDNGHSWQFDSTRPAKYSGYSISGAPKY